MNKKECCLAMAVMMMMDAAAAQGAMAAEKTQKSVPEAAPMDTYALDDTIVTATRSHKRDVDTPAATTVITEKQIKEQGARNAAEVLSKVNGFAYKSFGPAGVSMGTMNNEINIRGVKNGTLVLVNGSPISWRSKYNIEAIPADNIQRVEIVKGGGSVLYGSEAMCGVVNIITKKGGTNEARIGFGNYGQQQYYVNTGNERFGVHYSFDKWKRFDGVSQNDVAIKASKKAPSRITGWTRTDLRDIEHENAGLDFAINPRLDFVYDYFKTKSEFRRYMTSIDAVGAAAKVGDLFNNRKYTTEQQVVQFNYHDGAWKSNAYFNTSTIKSQGNNYFDSDLINAKAKKPISGTQEKNQTFGVDTQRDWRLNATTKATAGMDLQHELYQVLPSHETPIGTDHSRNNWGIFGQVEHTFNKRDTGTLGARETWTTGAKQNYNNFSLAGSWLHKLDDQNNLYLNISQSFAVPTFAMMYGASNQAIPAPGLKPQKGVNYEMGWKENHGAQVWRAAIFHMDIKDNITASWERSGKYYSYNNEDFRNTGLELSCDIRPQNAWSYHYGLTWQNPESKNSQKGYWDRTFGKLQLTGGVTYHKAKVTTTLEGSYLADRVQTPSGIPSYRTKPYFLTTWNTIYKPDAQSEIVLTIDNLLDRDDNTSYSGSLYHVAPANFMLSYSYKF